MARAVALDDKAAGQYARVNPDWLVALIDHAARVAVLEQQIAAVREESASAIEALARDGLTSPNGAQIQFDGSAVWALNAAAGAVRALAAGGVDNPTEDEANADPFTLDDLGHPTEGSPS